MKTYIIHSHFAPLFPLWKTVPFKYADATRPCWGCPMTSAPSPTCRGILAGLHNFCSSWKWLMCDDRFSLVSHNMLKISKTDVSWFITRTYHAREIFFLALYTMKMAGIMKTKYQGDGRVYAYYINLHNAYCFRLLTFQKLDGLNMIEWSYITGGFFSLQDIWFHVDKLSSAHVFGS